jgi:two-component system sensor histidine kinase ChvG
VARLRRDVAGALSRSGIGDRLAGLFDQCRVWISRCRIGARLVRLWRAFLVKLALLLVIFIAVPWILYGQFRSADAEMQRLLLKSAQEQGRLVVESVKPLLTRFDPGTVQRLGAALERIGSPETNIKVLFRPGDAPDSEQFYYVASAPAVPAPYLAAEQKKLIETGIFKRVPATCEEVDSSAARFTNPDGKEELLVSLTPVHTMPGCWVVITSSAAAEFLGTGIGRSYWKTPEVRIAALIYVMMAVFVVLLFLDGARSLRGFADLARRIRNRRGATATFAELNRVPELDGVALEFDRMVGSLRRSAKMIRYRAEDNAHAFKTPIAVIAQSLEPLKRVFGPTSGRPARAVEMIEQSVNRLDVLVSAARQMDEATAEIIDPSRDPVDVSGLLRRIGNEYTESLKRRNIRVGVSVDDAIVVLAQEDALETVFENLIENAASFSPSGGEIMLSAAVDGDWATITVEDSGPGVPDGNLERIFERYFSSRSADGADKEAHFGVGLWIVRRNIEVVGGSVVAENRESGGLRMRVGLPRV